MTSKSISKVCFQITSILYFSSMCAGSEVLVNGNSAVVRIDYSIAKNLIDPLEKAEINQDSRIDIVVSFNNDTNSDCFIEIKDVTCEFKTIEEISAKEGKNSVGVFGSRPGGGIAKYSPPPYIPDIMHSYVFLPKGERYDLYSIRRVIKVSDDQADVKINLSPMKIYNADHGKWDALNFEYKFKIDVVKKL